MKILLNKTFDALGSLFKKYTGNVIYTILGLMGASLKQTTIGEVVQPCPLKNV